MPSKKVPRIWLAGSQRIDVSQILTSAGSWHATFDICYAVQRQVLPKQRSSGRGARVVAEATAALVTAAALLTLDGFRLCQLGCTLSPVVYMMPCIQLST
mmetsp:Transcript_84100/g.167036  ORF Transcript_84100/g.167036 Transcript_84100/m.167036 type:complete len:100 (-) Transcript_84100:2-301(-)